MNLSNIDIIKNRIKDSINRPKSEDQLIENDVYMLMAGYLSEIERLTEGTLKRKVLANQIKTSPSYLTQVFRGDKPLNFQTLAKIQRALKIKFKVNGYHYNEFSFSGTIPTNLNGVQKLMENANGNMYAIPGKQPYSVSPNIKQGQTA